MKAAARFLDGAPDAVFALLLILATFAGVILAMGTFEVLWGLAR